MTSDEQVDWSLETISPADWLEILKLHLILSKEVKDKKGPTNDDYVEWLTRHKYVGKLNGAIISRIKAKHSRSGRSNSNEEKICEIISKNVTARSQIVYFEGLVYKALKFFFPSGNPLQYADIWMPQGLYQSKRYSFSEAGTVIQSAFLFYRNNVEDELLRGYGVYPGTGKSNVCRFKEFRKIELEGREYQIFVGGFVFYHNKSFYLVGASFETDKNQKESTLKACDIKKSHAVWYVLDDGHNKELLRGIKVTSLKYVNDPAAAVLELKRVGAETNAADWMDLSEVKNISIGVVSGKDADAIGLTLREELCGDYKMLVAKRKK